MSGVQDPCQQLDDIMVPNAWSHAPVNYLGSPYPPSKLVLEQDLQYMGHLTVVNGFILGYTHVSNWGVL